MGWSIGGVAQNHSIISTQQTTRSNQHFLGVLNMSSKGSPRVADCRCLRDFLHDKKGCRDINRDDPYLVQIAKCGICALVVDQG